MTIDFTQDIVLENDRVLLRPLAITDLDVLLAFSENEPELWTYSLTPAHGKENLINYINKALVARKLNTAYPFIVTDKGSGMKQMHTIIHKVKSWLRSIYSWVHAGQIENSLLNIVTG